MAQDGDAKFDELRARAERILEAESKAARAEVRRSVSELVEELHTHQIELELQNDELRQTQQALEVSQRRYRELFDFAPVSYLIFDQNGLVHDVNVTGTEQLKTTRERLIQKPFWLYLRPAYRDAFARHLGSVLDTERRQTCELEVERKDGSRCWVQLQSVPHDKPGEGRHVRTALVDISERKQLENELVAAREEAIQATQAQRVFLSNMSHEIRTPLTSVIGFAEVLGEMMATGERREFTEAIKSSGRRLLDTLNSVLDYTRIQQQDDQVLLKPTNVVGQAEECVRILQPQARDKAIRLTFASEGEAAYAALHEDYFGRVLNNVIGNALKYTDAGTVTVRVVRHEHEVEVRVDDTGRGIDSDLIDRIFEPFLQAHAGPGRSDEGVGLGLAITKQLVDRMDGRLEVESEVGVGSTFRIFFPCPADEQHVPVHGRAATSQPYARLAEADVLIVEDNVDTQRLVHLFLQERCRVHAAHTGTEAIAQLKRRMFDVILLDINLGQGRTGLELVQAIRQVKGCDAVPIVAFTAYALPGDEERFLEAGFDRYLRKPFTKRELLRTLDRALSDASKGSDEAPSSA